MSRVPTRILQQDNNILALPRIVPQGGLPSIIVPRGPLARRHPQSFQAKVLPPFPFPVFPSQYPPPTSTTSPSQVHPQPGQIFIHPPPGMPGVVQPGIVQPPVAQPVSHMSAPTPYLPHQSMYAPPGSAYIPAISIHRTHRSSPPSFSSPSHSWRSSRSSRSPSRLTRTRGPGVLVVQAAGTPAVPTTAVSGDADHRFSVEFTFHTPQGPEISSPKSEPQLELRSR
jgi:hypothetical protein